MVAHRGPGAAAWDHGEVKDPVRWSSSGSLESGLPPGAAARLGEGRLQHPGELLVVAEVGDEVWTAGGRSLRVFDRATGWPRQVQVLAAPLVAAALGTRGMALALARAGSHEVWYWSRATGAWSRLLADAARPLLALAPEDARLAVALGARVEWLDLDGQGLVHAASAEHGPVEDLRFTRDGARVVACVGGTRSGRGRRWVPRQLATWEVATGELVGTVVAGGDGRVRAPGTQLVRDVSGEHFLHPSGSGELPRAAPDPEAVRLHLRRLAEAVLGRRPEARDEAPVERLAVSPDRRYLASDRKVWSLEDPEVPWPLRAVPDLLALGFTPGVRSLLALTARDELHALDPRTGKKQRRKQARGSVKGAARLGHGVLSRDGAWVLVAEGDAMRARRSEDGARVGQTRVGALGALGIGASGVVTGDCAGVLRGWSLPDLEPTWEVPGAGQGPIQAVASGIGGEDLAYVQAGELRLHRRGGPAGDRVLGNLLGEPTLAFSPSGRLLAAAGDGLPEIHLFDLRAGRELEPLEGHLDGVGALAFAEDGARLFSGSRDATILAWDMDEVLRRRGLRGRA